MNNHFMQYNDIINKINEIQAKIIELKENIYSIRGVSYDDIPKGTSGNADITYFLIEIEELEDELKKLYEKKIDIKKNHEKEIDKLNVNEYKRILRMYYLMHFDIYKIADTLNKSRSYVYRLKGEAEKEFLRLNSTK